MDEQAAQLLGFQEILVDYLNALLETLPALISGVVVFIVFYILAGIGKRVASGAVSRATEDRSLQSLAGQMTRVFLLGLGIFAAAATVFPGLSAGHLISVLGLSSVAIGFAFKDIFQNFLAGVLILLQRPFQIGDQIETNGLEGTVEHISIRNTNIKTYDGQRILVPNAQIFTNPITVRTAYEKRRTTFVTGVGYGEDIDEARGVVMDAVVECEGVLDDPAPQALVSEHGDSAVTFEIRYWTESSAASVAKVRDRVATAVKNALDAADVEIPYPYRTVEFFDMSEKHAEAPAPETSSTAV
ncbi:MAG: mechanosensitive ion channel family protein [Persicimonas sp.]